MAKAEAQYTLSWPYLCLLSSDSHPPHSAASPHFHCSAFYCLCSGRNSSCCPWLPWQSQLLSFNIPDSNSNAQATLPNFPFAACPCFLHPLFFCTGTSPWVPGLATLISWCVFLFFWVIEETCLALGGCCTLSPHSFLVLLYLSEVPPVGSQLLVPPKMRSLFMLIPRSTVCCAHSSLPSWSWTPLFLNNYSLGCQWLSCSQPAVPC